VNGTAGTEYGLVEVEVAQDVQRRCGKYLFDKSRVVVYRVDKRDGIVRKDEDAI
jgi:hypothetical protein